MTTLDWNFDGTVKRVSTVYDGLGRPLTVTQHTIATVGGGSVVDEVKHTYEGWGYLDLFEQRASRLARQHTTHVFLARRIAMNLASRLRASSKIDQIS